MCNTAIHASNAAFYTGFCLLNCGNSYSFWNWTCSTVDLRVAVKNFITSIFYFTKFVIHFKVTISAKDLFQIRLTLTGNSSVAIVKIRLLYLWVCMIVGFKNKSGWRFKGHKEIAALHFFINQFRIQGAFGASMPVETTKKWSQKIKQYSKQSLLFIKEFINLFFCVWNLSKARHLKCLPLSHI